MKGCEAAAPIGLLCHYTLPLHQVAEVNRLQNLSKPVHK